MFQRESSSGKICSKRGKKGTCIKADGKCVDEGKNGSFLRDSHEGQKNNQSREQRTQTGQR